VPIGFIERELLRGAPGQQEHLNYKTLRRQFAAKSQGDPKTVARSGAVLRHRVHSSRKLENGSGAGLPSAITEPTENPAAGRATGVCIGA
jgi:hypothetical protein